MPLPVKYVLAGAVQGVCDEDPLGHALPIEQTVAASEPDTQYVPSGHWVREILPTGQKFPAVQLFFIEGVGQ
jgi:hypothetical protein